MIEIMVKTVGGKLEKRTVEGNVGEMQEIVQGYFETVNIPQDIVMWVNEEGLIHNKPLNFGIEAGGKRIMPVFGNAFFTGMTRSGDTASLTEVQMSWLTECFKEGGHALDDEIGAYKLGVLVVAK